MKQLVLASNNGGKLKEFGELLAPFDFQLLPQASLGVAEVEEPHATFVENALEKARHAARTTGLAALADDSGLCVIALSGAPGVLSARYAGEPKSDAANNARLLSELAGRADRSAHYYCVLVLLRHGDDPEPLIASGAWHGEILTAARGAGGFGYDPLFLVPEFGCSVAELASEQKNALSHRGQAMRQLVAMLRSAR